MSSATQLDAYLNGVKVGTFVHESPYARFFYDESYTGQPISLYLPRDSHRRNAMVYLEGLLPDNMATRDAWGRDYKLNPRNQFELLSKVGRDLPGAIQLVAHNEPLYTKTHSIAVAPASDSSQTPPKPQHQP